MTKYDMCEALCASSGGAVELRSKSLLMPILTLVAGVALLVVNGVVPATSGMMNLKSAIVLLGAVLAAIGVALVVYRAMGSDRAPYHTTDGCFLQKKELKFTKEKSHHIRDLVNRGEITTLRTLTEDGVSAVTAVIYTSPRSGFCAVQVFEYIEMELQPVSDLKIIKG